MMWYVLFSFGLLLVVEAEMIKNTEQTALLFFDKHHLLKSTGLDFHVGEPKLLTTFKASFF
jgi:hypothetical protein